MGKITSFSKLVKLRKDLKSQGKTVGYLTGCFDILHIGHIHLFRRAKSKCDVLIVGIDSDETIKKSKGVNRPINSWKFRSLLLSELKSIDYIFKINCTHHYDSLELEKYHQYLVDNLKPDSITVHSSSDKYWRNKKHRIEKNGGKVIHDHQKKISSSSEILSRLMKEN